MENDKEIVYTTMIDDIRHAKNQQWLITYYVLLLMSGIVGFHNFLASRCCNISPDFIFICKSAVVVIPIFANWFILQYQAKIIRYRYFKNISLSEEQKKILEIKWDESWTCWFKDLYVNNFCLIFISIFFIINFFVSVYLFKTISGYFLALLMASFLITNLIFILRFNKKYKKYKK